uniref:GDSL esterase/lipase EXL3-like n=1 Tax=Nelumbo nucifera TaxID=4432 RepID=A0A822ZPK7_NELNU|nr:TPA_asm: hypothetical protein HUJ06_016690 [Nelumbo nucifera]
MDYIPSPCFLGQFLTLLIPFLSHLSQGALVPPQKNITVPAVYVFGDSIVDTGNNNYLFSVVKCNFPPYGRDFMGGRATGRCSNGRLPSDLLGSITKLISFLFIN